VKELDGFRNAVLDDHSLRIAGHKGGAFDLEVVGQNDRRLFMAQIGDCNLTELIMIMSLRQP